MRHLSLRLLSLLAVSSLLAAACGTDSTQTTADAVLQGGAPVTEGEGDGDTADPTSDVDDSSDDQTTTETSSDTDTDADPDADSGETAGSELPRRVEPPVCDPGPRSLYEPPTNNANVSDITTNQIIDGQIEAFSVDVWKIDLCAGQVVFFDGLGPCLGEDGDWLEWQLIVPEGDQATDLGNLINSVGACDGDRGPITIRESGQYAIQVGYDDIADQEAPEYRFEVLNVPPPDEFTIAFGDTLDADFGPGAGRIEYPGSRDLYRIDLVEGDRIFLGSAEDCRGSSGDWLNAELILPDGDEVINVGNLINSVGACQDVGPVEVPETGTYVLDIGYGPDSDSTARRYSVEVRDAG